MFKQKSGFRIVKWLRENSPGSLVGLATFVQGRAKHRLWQEGKGYGRNLWTPPLIWKSIRYIHGNPVARGLCEAPEDWQWSSYRWFLGLRPAEFAPDPCSVEPHDPSSGIWTVWFEPE